MNSIWVGAVTRQVEDSARLPELQPNAAARFRDEQLDWRLYCAGRSNPPETF